MSLRFPEWPFPFELDSLPKIQEYMEQLYTALVEDSLMRTEDLNTTDITTTGAIEAPTVEGTTTVTTPSVVLDGSTHDTTLEAGTPTESNTYVLPAAKPTANKQVFAIDTDGTMSFVSADGIDGFPTSYSAKKLVVNNEAGNAWANASNAEWDETNDRLEITSSSAHCIKSIRTTNNVQLTGSAFMIKNKCSGNMADPFGVSIAFAIQDDTSAETVIGNVVCCRDGADNSGQLRFRIYNAGTQVTVFTVTKEQNLVLGYNQTTDHASMTKGLTMYTGTAPSDIVADSFAMYSKDVDDVGGTAAPHFLTEENKVIRLYQQANIVDANVSHAVTDFSETNTALDALGITINSILDILENSGQMST